MKRAIYAAELRMHPRAFRERFADEMLCIFDEAAEAEGALKLLIDGAISLLRQWVMRSDIWKPALAALFTMAQVTMISFMLHLPRLVPRRANQIVRGAAPTIGMLQLMLSVATLTVIVVAAITLWITRFQSKRSQPCGRRRSAAT